jgi:hypothetical protein
MGNMMATFPSYAPAYRDFPQYSIWGESFLMYFFVIFTTFALATVTMMDTNGSSSSSSFANMVPAVELPGAPKTGGKKHQKKH